MFESIHFCLITFSTIGFGDFVTLDENEANTFVGYLIVILGVVLASGNKKETETVTT